MIRLIANMVFEFFDRPFEYLIVAVFAFGFSIGFSSMGFLPMKFAILFGLFATLFVLFVTSLEMN